LPHTAPPRAESAGFTLVEVLVALTLLALLLPLAFGALRQATAAWERIGGDAAAAEQINGAQAFLMRQLTQAYPAYLGTLPTPQIDFEGRAGELGFVAPLPAALQVGGMGRYRVATEWREGRRDLVLRWQAQLGRDDRPRQTLPLVTDIDRVELRYFGATRPGGPPAWHREWRAAQSLPSLIAMQVVFRPRDRRAWPELVVATAIDVDGTCLFDPLTRGCRGR
jgi:general secretion pathway protein J